STREVLGAPLNVEDAVGRTATNRSEDPKSRIYQVQVVPVREDGVVVGEPRQATVSEGSIQGGELGIAVRRQVYRVKRLVVQSVREGQCHGGYLIVPVIADVYRAWHDAAPYLRYVVVVCRRATLYCVGPREGRNTIAGVSSDRPGPNARRHAASEIEMHREPGSRVAVDQTDSGHAAANIA